MSPLSPNRNRRGERVLRTGQTGDRLVNVMLVIVIAAAIGFVGTDVTSAINSSVHDTSLDGSTVTTVNESVGTVVFDSTNDRFDYTVSEAGSSNLASFQDDEQVFNTTSDTQLTEDTDYIWYTNNGTVRILNTSATGNNTADTVITYNHTERDTGFSQANRNLSAGFGSAMSLVDVVFIVLLFSVILGALLVFRNQRGL